MKAFNLLAAYTSMLNLLPSVHLKQTDTSGTPGVRKRRIKRKAKRNARKLNRK